MKLGTNSIAGGPFTVGSHEKVTPINFENARKNKFRKVGTGLFSDQDVPFYGFVVYEIILGTVDLIACVMDAFGSKLLHVFINLFSSEVFV